MERMVTIYMKNDILSLKRSGMSNRKMALKLNISKDTVNKYVKEMNELGNVLRLNIVLAHSFYI